MKILLTGGAGFIGSHTCVELCDAGYEPVIVDNYINSSPESIRRIEQIVGHPVSHYEADVSDRAAMARIFDENSFDCVIHFATFPFFALPFCCSVTLLICCCVIL